MPKSDCPLVNNQEMANKVGSEVEVTCSDIRLRGTLFQAKVIDQNFKAKKLVVEYKFVKDKKTNEAIREEVDMCMVRPLQPKHRNYIFKYGDNVDAFFIGGWWEGWVTKVLDGSKFQVYFRCFQNQFLFSSSVLRLHQEWVDGRWAPSVVKDGEEMLNIKKRKSTKDLTREKITEGTLIEVSSDEEGFVGAWFAAIVIKAVKEDKYIIEYESLRTDDDTEFMKEEVDIHHIRPLPPHIDIPPNGFTVGQQVDALYNDGWWEGKITKVLLYSRYKVYFPGTGDECEFYQSELRLHQHWIHGTWEVLEY
ncbi:Agenet-like domain [Quillaja saponaria]|uniref:Agenet-like domain n=1 Tax=Quillaja saponaria TaxID=32244 RepID=A0AAD7L1J6_QUISA|nr:Agenet-like domain [Quillaja saponaria]